MVFPRGDEMNDWKLKPGTIIIVRLEKMERNTPLVVPNPENASIQHPKKSRKKTNCGSQSKTAAAQDGNTLIMKPGECICSRCGKTLSSTRRLYLHGLIHNMKQPFICPLCPASTNYSCLTGLSRHLLEAHDDKGKTSYSCDVCGKHYSRPDGLKRHLLTHSGEKTYSCEFCEKKFYRLDHLTKHIKFHTGEKPYSCGFCRKRYTEKYALVLHSVVHTGEYTHICSTCGKGCTTAQRLKFHEDTHGRETI